MRKCESFLTPKVLALDFDGVITNSVNECAVSGYNAYNSDRDPSGFTHVTAVDDIPDQLLENFLTLRHFIRNSEDYVYIFHSIDNGLTVKSQEDFDKGLKAFGTLKARYSSGFYTARKWLLKNNRDAWLRLSPLYPGMKKFLKTVTASENFFIVSTKATEFITEILTFNGLMMDKKRIPQATGDISKRNIIARIINEKGIAPADLVFVDDHLGTALKVRETGARCYLAPWGYNTEDQKLEAQKNGIGVMGLDIFLSSVKL